MKLSEIHKKFKQIIGFYGGQPPISVLTGITGLPRDDTITLWKEYISTLPEEEKPLPRKRGPKPKRQPVKRTPRVKKEPTPEVRPEDPPVVVEQLSVGNDINVGSNSVKKKAGFFSKILGGLSNVTYGILVVSEIIVAFVAMFSIGENPALQWVLGVLGGVLTFVGISMFLRGQNTKGPEKMLYYGFWILYVIVFVTLNWAWVIGNLETGWKEQATQMEYKKADETTYADNEKAIREIEKKLNSTSQWVENYAEIVTVSTNQKNILIQQNEKIRERLAVTTGHNSLSVFATMGGLLGWEGIQTSKFWYLLFLLLIQGATVLTVPKNKD